MTADPALRDALIDVMHGQFAAFFDRDVCAEAADAILSSGLVVGAGAYGGEDLIGCEHAIRALTPPATLARPDGGDKPPQLTQPLTDEEIRRIVGRVMRETHGKANPVKVGAIVREAARPEITDAMVERAARAVWDRDDEGGWDRAKIHFPGTIDFALGAARAALTAALTDGDDNGR